MFIADIKELDIQDGEGARVSIYVSGCHFHCKGCHNPQAWNFNYGREFTDEDINHIVNLMDNDYISGLSILGGEPMELINQKGLVPLVNKVKEKFPNKNIWCYTGYDFEKDVLGNMVPKFEFTKDFLKKIDIVVDGQFVEDKKLVDLKFRGSYNQRKIDVQKTLETNSLVTMKFGDEVRYGGVA
ncbi:MAG: anaerobic ribonucleoside-triphosphate reductase activating protein [Clostridia bacterium]|nr:anaerobic ribonucleoside-triphosphate reductase activating protein [Clostridia bacterium]